MTSSGHGGTWPRCGWCLLTFWSVVSLRWTSDLVVHGANSISVLDSKLSSLYQKFHQQPYQDADYATRNAFQPYHHSSDDGYHTKTVPYQHDHSPDDGYNTRTVPYPHGHSADDGYHTRTVPYHHDDGYGTRTVPYHHVHLPYPDGYAFQLPGGKDAAAVDDGYHTRTTGYHLFPLYQPYQHAYDAAEPAGGYATRTALNRPYRSAGQDAAAAKSEHVDDGYRTGGASDWLRGRSHGDPGGYATQNAAFDRPYRSAVDWHDGHQTRIDPGGKYAVTKDLRGLDGRETVHEDDVVHGQFHSDDDDAGLTTEWSSEQLATAPDAATDHHRGNGFRQQQPAAVVVVST